MRFKIPDWLIYGAIVALIYLNATRTVRQEQNQPPPPPDLGDLLPRENPRDPTILVNIDEPTSGSGTAFAISDNGKWLTARHVVDGCNKVALQISDFRAVRMNVEIEDNMDVAVLTADWNRKPIPLDVDSTRTIGEYGYFFGFPQGQPGEVVGSLLGRSKLVVRGRYNTRENVLAWTEVGRSRGLSGSLGGLSGAPVLDGDGEVIGIVAAESPRRGRIYSVAPKNIAKHVETSAAYPANPINLERYGSDADDYRRERRIAQVICLVK